MNILTNWIYLEAIVVRYFRSAVSSIAYNMTTEERIIDYMNNYEPSEATIKDGCVTYHSTTRTHRSYAAYLKHAPDGSFVRKAYLKRCYGWLMLLKKNGIEMYHTIK